MKETEMQNQYENPKKSNIRWIVLVLVCLSTFGDYYCIDNPGALHEPLKNQFKYLGKSYEFYFNMLYSVYSMPNIVLPFVGGIFVMYFGIRTMYAVFGIFLMSGQFIFALGGTYNSIYTMLLGRIIFGFGGESLNITQNAMICKWFFKSEIALPLGLTISISRLGSVLNDNISPRLSSANDSSKALWIGFIICVFSFFASMILCFIDLKEEQRNPNKESIEENKDNKEEPSAWESLKSLSLIFWVITALCVLLYGCVLPFNNIASGFYANTWFNSLPKEEANHKAGIAMSVPFFISAILVPFFGVFIDKFGNRAYLSFVSAIFCLFSFGLFYSTTPIYAIILLGVTYSLFASVIWPAISLVVPTKYVGFAYGVTTSVQNMGLAIFPLIVAWVYNSSGEDYYKTLYFFVFLSCLSILSSVYLIYLDHINDNIINTNIFIEEEETEKKSLVKNEEKAIEGSYGSIQTSANSVQKAV